MNQRLKNNTKFEILPISERKVFEYIRGIDTTKAKGLDEISPHYLKMAAEDVTPSLTYLCNLSLETGQFPKEWKKGKVISGYKKDIITSKEYYRPLSILLVLSKILEKHVFSTYYQYLNNHNLLSNYQHGFRKYHSCETILMLMFKKLICNIEKGEITAMTSQKHLT